MPEKNHGPESLSSFFPHFAQAALRSTRHLESSVGFLPFLSFFAWLITAWRCVSAIVW